MEEVSLLRGRGQIVFGDAVLSANEIVLWRRTDGGQETLTVYLEGEARLKRTGRQEDMPSMVLDMSADAVEFQVTGETLEENAEQDPLYLRAVMRRRAATGAGVRAVRRPVEVPDEAADPIGETVRMRPTTGQLRRIRMFPRSAAPFNVETKLSERSIPPEQVILIDGGVNVLIDGFDGSNVVDLSADRIVIWSRGRRPRRSSRRRSCRRPRRRSRSTWKATSSSGGRGRADPRSSRPPAACTTPGTTAR